MKITLKDAILINPEQKLNQKADILITDGVITKIGEISSAESKDSQIFEFKDKYISPGFFDMHVHFREPGREDEETIETGCDSAAEGGFTGAACMPNTNPPIDGAETTALIKQKSALHLVDVYPIAAATKERRGESISPMYELVEAGAVGFSDDGAAIKNAKILATVLEYSSVFGLPIIEHCEDESFAGGAANESVISTMLGLSGIPTIAEDLIVMRDIIVAEYVGGIIHIAHISSKKSVEMVRQAKKRGAKITAEATPHHFTLTDECIKLFDANYKMNPPLRSKEDVESIIEGLKDGTIDCIATDHAPHSIEEKEMEFIYAPNGIIGLETAVGLVFNELYHKKVLTLEQIIEKLSINPRKILRIPTPKIEIGEKANLTIFDPNLVWTVDSSKFKSKSKNTPFDKKLLTGKAIAVINNNKMLYQGTYTNI